jgi:actin-related protein 10
MLREEYDALVLAHAEKGEAYRYRLAEEDAFFAEMSKGSLGGTEGTVPPPSGGTDEVGVSIEDLLPGMALSRAGQGRRGWEANVRLGDWSRVVKA